MSHIVFYIHLYFYFLVSCGQVVGQLYKANCEVSQWLGVTIDMLFKLIGVL